MVQTTISTYGEENEEKYEKVVVKKDISASKGPFKCCFEFTKKTSKKLSYKGIDYNYDVWRCKICKREYLDTTQAKKMEKFWLVEKLLDEKLISMTRKMNFDGKTFFFRFPKELTQNWNKDSSAEIRIINPETFLVEIKAEE